MKMVITMMITMMMMVTLTMTMMMMTMSMIMMVMINDECTALSRLRMIMRGLMWFKKLAPSCRSHDDDDDHDDGFDVGDNYHDDKDDVDQ